MADTTAAARPSGSSSGAAAGKGGKILGMPRTTGIIVLAAGAFIIGYFLISKFTGQSSGQGQGKGQGGGGGGGYGPGGPGQVRVIREWQGHPHRRGRR